MHLGDIFDAILNTAGDDWYRVPGIETVNQHIVTWTSGDSDFGGLETRQHRELAVLIADPAVGLATGLEHLDGKEWSPQKWATAFPDETVYGYYVDILYNGVPVHRELGVSVDGGRVLLPYPRAGADDDDTWTVPAFDAQLFRLADQVFSSASYSYDDYLNRSGFRIEGSGHPLQ